MQSLNLFLILLNTSHALHIFDSCESAFSLITHYVLLNLLTDNHISHSTLCYVTQLQTNSLVLDLLWLQNHKVIINCEKNYLVFNFTHCYQWCMFTKTVIFCVLRNFFELSVSESTLNICIINTAFIICLTQCKNYQLFVTSVKAIEEALTLWETVNVLIKLLREYHEFATLFFWEKSDKLFWHHFYDHIISLLSDKEPSKGSLYNMFKDELLILQKYLKKHLFKSYI